MSDELRKALRRAVNEALDSWDGETSEPEWITDAVLAALPTAPGVTVEHAIQGNFLGRIPTTRICTGEAARRTMADGDLVLDDRQHVTRVCLPWQPAPKEKP